MPADRSALPGRPSPRRRLSGESIRSALGAIVARSAKRAAAKGAPVGSVARVLAPTAAVLPPTAPTAPRETRPTRRTLAPSRAAVARAESQPAIPAHVLRALLATADDNRREGERRTATPAVPAPPATRRGLRSGRLTAEPVLVRPQPVIAAEQARERDTELRKRREAKLHRPARPIMQGAPLLREVMKQKMAAMRSPFFRSGHTPLPLRMVDREQVFHEVFGRFGEASAAPLQAWLRAERTLARAHRQMVAAAANEPGVAGEFQLPARPARAHAA